MDHIYMSTLGIMPYLGIIALDSFGKVYMDLQLYVLVLLLQNVTEGLLFQEDINA